MILFLSSSFFFDLIWGADGCSTVLDSAPRYKKKRRLKSHHFSLGGSPSLPPCTQQQMFSATYFFQREGERGRDYASPATYNLILRQKEEEEEGRTEVDACSITPIRTYFLCAPFRIQQIIIKRQQKREIQKGTGRSKPISDVPPVPLLLPFLGSLFDFEHPLGKGESGYRG